MNYTPDILYKAETDFASSQNISIAGLDEIHRLRQTQKTDLPTVWHQVAVWIFAPVLAGYADWMNEHAKNSVALFGVMREGRLLTRLMQTLCGQSAQEIWLNRDLTMLAAFGCGNDESLINWLVRTRLKPMTYVEAAKQLLGTPYTAFNPNKFIDVSGAQALLQEWKENGLLDQARNRAANLAARLFNHWQNIAGKSSGTILLMDFAAAGNIQRSLQTILTAKNDKASIIGLNFAMTTGSQWAEKAGCHMHGYLSERGEPEWFADAYARTPELMEIFAAAPIGSLKDYSEKGEPIFGESFLNESQKKLTLELQDQIIETAKLYHREIGNKLTPDLGRLLWGRLLLQPLKEEVIAMADWPLDAGLDGSRQRLLAAKLNGSPEQWTKSQTAWPAASLVRSQAEG